MYAKLFSRITESSLMEEPLPVRYVFVMLLAISDPQGYVIGTDVALARKLNISLHDFTSALDKLKATDPDSGSPELEGRRIVPSDAERGYRIVNFIAYRDTKDPMDRREYMRNYMAKYRKTHKPVNSRKLVLTDLTHAEADAEADANEEAEEEDKGVCLLKSKEGGTGGRFKKPSLEEIKLHFAKSGLPESEAEKFFNYYESNGWRVGKNPMKSWHGAAGNWKKNFEERRFENSSTKRGEQPKKSIIEQEIEAMNRHLERTK